MSSLCPGQKATSTYQDTTEEHQQKRVKHDILKADWDTAPATATSGKRKTTGKRKHEKSDDDEIQQPMDKTTMDDWAEARSLATGQISRLGDIRQPASKRNSASAKATAPSSSSKALLGCKGSIICLV